jgi:hypothetical protein
VLQRRDWQGCSHGEGAYLPILLRYGHLIGKLRHAVQAIADAPIQARPTRQQRQLLQRNAYLGEEKQPHAKILNMLRFMNKRMSARIKLVMLCAG